MIKYLFCLCIIALFLSACVDTSTPQDHAFWDQLNKNFRNDGDKLKLSDLHSGNWKEVCPVIEYERASTIAAMALGKKRGEVKIINTNDEVASSEQWGLVFLYPPDKAEYIRISHYFYMNGDDTKGCIPQKNAFLEFYYKQERIKRVRLLNQ